MLEAKNLSKHYGEHKALKELNIKVNPGEIYCLLGANGAGKSTTINLFLNFTQPTSGQALVCGMSVTEHALKTKAYISYIPENLMLYPELTGMENLDFFCKLANSRYTKKELEIMLGNAGLQTGFIHKRVNTYSKGMRQKVGIALAVARNTEVLLLDEPTSGLDPKAANEFSQLLLDMKQKGVTILMATHDLFRAKETGTHIGIMKDGALVDTFSAGEITLTALEKCYLQHMEIKFDGTVNSSL
ncbi:MAG: ABC transporter ATP-binding protein [Cytophagaceae bacterium]